MTPASERTQGQMSATGTSGSPRPNGSQRDCWPVGSIAMKWALPIVAIAITILALPSLTWAQSTTPAMHERVIAPERLVSAIGLSVAVNKSQVLHVDRPFTDLAIGKSEIADVIALTNQSVYVLGKAVGATTLAVYGHGRQLIAMVNIAVTQDVGAIREKLHEILPNERIEVRSAADSVILGGTVSTAQAAARAVEVAQQYAPGKVVNMMTVKGTQQVMLAVRIAEMSRTVARALGINPSVLLGKNPQLSVTSLDPINSSAFSGSFLQTLASTAGVVNTTSFGSAVLNWATGFFSLSALIDALEQNGVVKILAEPDLVALSGDTASFLAGGEFPVPEVQASTGTVPTIAVQYKSFGVSLSFTPTVIDHDLINLVVSPEVSQIDTTNSVVVSGFSIPGISTRRAHTTIELRDGQSFAIAGLLQSNITDQVRQVPGLGELPVLGALFRDTQFMNQETELVIIVTPHLVKPAPAGTLAAPTDTFVPPSTADLFFKGEVEAPKSGLSDARDVLGTSTGGGFDGDYGYIVK